MKTSKLIQSWTLAIVLPACGVLNVYAFSPQFAQLQDLEQQLQQDAEGTPIQPFQSPLGVQEPRPEIDKDRVGWKEASLGDDGTRLTDTIRANWVMISKTDGISGRLIGGVNISINNVSVFLLRNGFPVAQARSNDIGEFRFEGTSPGQYTIVGFSPDAIFTFGFNAVEFHEPAIGMPLTITVLPIHGRENNRLVIKLIKQNAPSVAFRLYGTYDISEDETDPVEYYGWKGLKNLKVNTVAATTISGQQIRLQNGRFVGRIHQVDNQSGRPVEVQSTQISLIQNGQVIAETTVDNLGVFEFRNLSTGTYGLVAHGRDGLGAVGLDLIGDAIPQLDDTTQTNIGRDTRFQNISHQPQANGGGSVDIMLVDTASIGWINSFVQEQEFDIAMQEPRPQLTPQNYNPLGGAPYDYFSYGGGGYGGGGGGGFGGGNAAFWLVPAGIAAIVIAASEDNNNNQSFTIVSPFFP